MLMKFGAARQPRQRFTRHAPGGIGQTVTPTRPGIEQGEHIYVGDKAKWYEITDGLPLFSEEPN